MNTKKIWVLFTRALPIFFVVFLLGLLPAESAAADKTIRVGFIDMQKAVLSTKELKKKLTAFRTEINKEKMVMDAKEKKIKQMFDELNKQEFVLSEDLKKKKRENFRQKKRDFERYVQDLNEKFASREQEIKNEAIKKMLEVIQKIGKERKFTMIIEKSALFYTAKEYDLTDAAIAAYNKIYK